MWLALSNRSRGPLLPFGSFASGGRGNPKPERQQWATSSLAPYTLGIGQSNLEVVQHGECYVERRNEMRYAFTKIVLRAPNGLLYYATTHSRPGIDCRFDIDELDKKRIPLDAVYPLCPEGDDFTRAPDPLPADVYVKEPNLLDYGDTEEHLDIGGHVLREAKVCELLRKSPHPNVATYRGCIIKDGRIRGVCYTRYRMSLVERLQKDGRDGLPALERRRCYEGIEAGIHHLHHLGLIHNNVCPANIMLDAADNPVIIDFDCCRPEGERLGPKGYNAGWSLEGAKVAKLKNDLYSLLRIRDHLQGLYG
jgi:serine/threonine protein kinase